MQATAQTRAAADVLIVRPQDGDLMQSLDELLSQEPHATFHDATVVEVQRDAVARWAAFTADLCVGDPAASTVEERQRRRRGRLSLEGVRLWREDGPDSASTPGDWLTAEGPLAEVTTELGRMLHRDLRLSRTAGISTSRVPTHSCIGPRGTWHLNGRSRPSLRPNKRMQPTGRGGPARRSGATVPVAVQWKRRFVRARA
jgi:hypothetical protein